MLDVGQGDSILIYSKGEATLVDTGGIQNKDATIVRRCKKNKKFGNNAR